MKLYSDAATRGNYNGLPRTDFKRIKQFWGDEMTMVVPFYNNFLHNNLFNFNSCIPKIDGFDPIFAVESHDLPYDGVMRQKMEGYAKEGGYEVVEARSTYYRAKKDFLSYLTYKCIQNRSSIECPNLEGMCSENFFAIKSLQTQSDI